MAGRTVALRSANGTLHDKNIVEDVGMGAILAWLLLLW